jgi:hypothetical protein
LEAYYDQVRSAGPPAGLAVERTSPVRDASLGGMVALLALFVVIGLAQAIQKGVPPTVVVGAEAYTQAAALEQPRRPDDKTRGERWIDRLA